MNKFFRKVTLISGAACGLFLISCQDEGAVTAIQPVGNNAGIAQAPPSMIAEYRLAKIDNDTLIYNSDGRIKQFVEIEGNTTYRTDYEYAPNSIIATRFMNNKPSVKKEWTLANGRAVKLLYKNFETNNLSGVSKTYIDYEYNNKNQLVKVITQSGIKTTGTLSYDDMGNVVKFLFVKSTSQGDQFLNLVKYDYTEYVGSPTETEKGSTINLHVFGPNTIGDFGDPYLPIFGKFGKNLLKKLTATNGPASSIKYAYSLDANGYVKERKIVSKNGGYYGIEQLQYVQPPKISQ